MENWIELLIIILFFAFSALGSLTNSKNKKSKDSTLSDAWDEDTSSYDKKTTPPLTPVNQPRQKSFDDSSVWSAPTTAQKQNQSDYYKDHHYDNDMQDFRDDQQRTIRRRSLDPMDDPVVTQRHEQEKSLQDVFREIFQVEDYEQKEVPAPYQDYQEPQPAPKPKPKPKPERKPIKRETERVESTTRKSQIMAGHTASYGGYDPHPFSRLAKEAQINPTRTAIIFAEIMSRPKPIRPFPKLPKKS